MVDNIEAFDLSVTVADSHHMPWPLSSAHSFPTFSVPQTLDPSSSFTLESGQASPITVSPLDPSPAQTSSSSPKRPSQHQDIYNDRLLKRQRNNFAARKYRQKKVDRIKELEDEVDEIKRERDDLRIRLARQEAETAALRDMLRLGNPGMANGR